MDDDTYVWSSTQVVADVSDYQLQMVWAEVLPAPLHVSRSSLLIHALERRITRRQWVRSCTIRIKRLRMATLLLRRVRGRQEQGDQTRILPPLPWLTRVLRRTRGILESSATKLQREPALMLCFNWPSSLPSYDRCWRCSRTPRGRCPPSCVASPRLHPPRFLHHTTRSSSSNRIVGFPRYVGASKAYLSLSLFVSCRYHL